MPIASRAVKSSDYAPEAPLIFKVGDVLRIQCDTLVFKVGDIVKVDKVEYSGWQFYHCSLINRGGKEIGVSHPRYCTSWLANWEGLPVTTNSIRFKRRREPCVNRDVSVVSPA